MTGDEINRTLTEMHLEHWRDYGLDSSERA